MKKILTLILFLFFQIYSADSSLIPTVTNKTNDTLNIEGKLVFVRKLSIPAGMNDHRKTIVFLRRIQGFKLILSLQNESQVQSDEKQFRVYPNPKFIQSSLLFDKYLHEVDASVLENYFVFVLNNVEKDNKPEYIYSGRRVFKNENPKITDQDFEAPRDRVRLDREHERE